MTEARKPSSVVEKNAVLLAAAWTLVVGVSFTWSCLHERDAARRAAIVSANAQFSKDVIYRRWNAGHGGATFPSPNRPGRIPY